MSVFKAYSNNVEVNGETVLSVVDGMGNMKSVALKILADAGMPNVEKGKWYKQQDWLNAFKLISEKVGKNSLKMIGKSIPENAKFPPQIQDIHSALSAIDIAYKMNHRNGEIGFYKYSKISDNEAEVHCKNPYPSEFDEGIIEAIAKKFSKAGQNPNVTLSTDKETRRNGAESCTFIIKWFRSKLH